MTLRRILHAVVRTSVALLLLGAVVWSVQQPTGLAQSRYKTLGPNECVNCHDHQTDRQWWERQEIPEVQRLFPNKGANAGHVNALKQLEMPKSDAFAKAVGVRDKYDVNGSCVKCHATVFAGDANAGVSCESCHGAGEGYVKVHQTKGAYEQSVKVGMTNLVGNIDAWVRQCTSCHVLEDKRLIDAGHPSGDDFDMSRAYVPVALHFKRKYDAAKVSAIARPMVQALVAKRGGGAPAPAPVATPPAAAPTTTVVTPPPTPTPPVQTAPPQTTVATPPPPQAAPRAPAVVNTPAPSASPVQQPTVAAPPAQPAVTSTPGAVTPTPTMPVASGTLPASLPSAVAAVQGRLILALTELLQNGASAPVRTSTPAPALAPYSGPDAALLQLQREAIALALEVLGTAPAPPAAPAPQP